MAKDILVNTQSGDLVISEGASQTMYWNVVWGKLFDSDETEYMNIVVPSGYVNKVHYKNLEFQCPVYANYYPVNSAFLVRLVVNNIATGHYDLIQEYSIDAPEPMGAVYYPKYTEKSQDIKACQLPLINAEGKFIILFKKYSNSNFSRAIISSAKDLDFTIGSADSQSAQLLAKCAPGKYYRYPTTGVDLTKYINSIAEHTDLTSQLVKQFTADSKQISEAEFDSVTGDLKIAFSGTSEAEDENLTAPEKLDVEVFRVADDDFIRATYREIMGVADDSEEFIQSLVSMSNFTGIYDIGSAAMLDSIFPNITLKAINADGTLADSKTEYAAFMDIKAGKMYAICYPSSIVKITLGSTQTPMSWSHPSLFALYQNNKTVYVDEPFYTNSPVEANIYKNTFVNRRCFIALSDMSIAFYAGAKDNNLFTQGYGIYPLKDNNGNFSSMLGLSANNTTGQLTAITTNHSLIESVSIDIRTNQILIIKQ